MESETSTPPKPWAASKIKHGHIDDLCANLGYPLLEQAGRKGSKFANKAASFRKALLGSAPNFPRCPIDTEEPDAQMYVEKFLEKNPDLFQPSVEAQEHGWPYLPENKDHIIEYLKKLMCQQEINWRNNNNNYVKNGFKWTHQLQAEPELKKPATSKKVPRPKSKEDEDESHNITVHLEYIFPLDLDASSSSTWLIEPIEYDKMAGKKIIVAENVDPFVLRYLHDRDLYDANDRNAIEDFARDVSRQYPLTALNLEEVITRCTEMVKEFATAWSPKGGFGFLEKHATTWRKSAKFAGKWASRRQEWLQTVHNGSSDEVIEWFNDSTIHENAREPNLKREYVVDDDSSPAIPTKWKRPRTEGPGIPLVSHKTVEQMLRVYEEDPSNSSATRNPNSRFMPSVHRRGGGKGGRGGKRISAGIPHRDIEDMDARRSSLPTYVKPPSHMASHYLPTDKQRPPAGCQVTSSSFSDFSDNEAQQARSLTTTPQLSTSRQSQSMSHPSPRLPHAHTSQRGQAIAHKTLGPPHASTSRNGRPASFKPSLKENSSTAQRHTPSSQPCVLTGRQSQSNTTSSRLYTSPEHHERPSVIHGQTPVASSSRPYHSSTSIARSPTSTPPEPLNAYAGSTIMAISGSIKDTPAKRIITREPAVESTIEPQNGASDDGVTPISSTGHSLIVRERGIIASRSTPYQYPGSSLSRENLPHYPIPRENASRSPAPPPIFDEPKKVQLFFTVEDRFGDLDDKNAFSQKNMFGMDLTTLFNTVSHSANKRLLELTDISFRCRWTPPRTFVLNRDDGEDKWKRTKDKLQDNFDIAKDRFRQRTSFEIWVLCGDMKKEALEATEDGLN